MNFPPNVAIGDNVFVISPSSEPKVKTVLDFSSYSMNFTDGSSIYLYERNATDLVIKQDDPRLIDVEGKYVAYETLLVIGSSALRNSLLDDPEVVALLAALRKKVTEADFQKTKALLTACCAISRKEEFIHSKLKGML